MKPEQLDNLEALARKATPGPWYVDDIKNEGDYGYGPDTHSGFRSQSVCDEKNGYTLFDTLNSDACVVDVDEGGAWDSVGDCNSAYIAAANPTVVLALIDRIRELEAKYAAADAEVTRLAVAAQPVETIDGDEFNKLLEECGAYEDNECSFALDAKRALIAHIDARLAAASKPQWISVSERLPEDADKSMGTNNEGYVWAEWNGAGDWYEDRVRTGLARHIPSLGWQPLGCAGYDWNVSHWMPLPPVPSMSAAEGERKP